MNIEAIMHGRTNTEAIDKMKKSLIPAVTILFQYHLFDVEKLEDEKFENRFAELGRRYGNTHMMEDLFLEQYDRVAYEQVGNLTAMVNANLDGKFEFDEDEIFDFIYDFMPSICTAVAVKIRDACEKFGIKFQLEKDDGMVEPEK